MSDSKSASGGIGFGGALTILFIGLKLGKVIDWSWWWVMSPVWIPLLICFAVFIGAVAFYFTKAFFNWRKKRGG